MSLTAFHPGSAEVCKTHAAECKRLGMDPEISVRRATILMNMATSWATLGNQTERFDEIVRAETARVIVA